MSLKNKFKFGIFGVVAILIIVIIFQNMETASTKLLFVTIKMPRAALLFVFIAVGFLLGQVFQINLKRRKE